MKEKNISELSFKIIIVGDAGVGKTCLTRRATSDEFSEDYSSTIGFEYFDFNEKINDKNINLKIWDTCGQEKFRSLIVNFYREASLAMLVYSINSQQSFNHLEKWLKEIKLHSNNPDIKVMLIATKKDLEEEREVDYQIAKKFTDENNILYFEETSSKTGINSKEVFTQAAKILYEEFCKYISKENEKVNKPSPIKLEKGKENREKGCC